MSKTNKGRKRYSKEFKESVLQRLESSNETVKSISEELNIPRTTIYQWIKTKNNSLNKPKPIGKWTSEDKFHVVLETYALTQEELAAYCRRKGLYIEDLNLWREQCIKANKADTKDPLKLEQNLKEEKQRTKQLEKELRTKEKALAETAALLVLRKKAQAIWGVPEEE
jgi:transposase-like protein